MPGQGSGPALREHGRPAEGAHGGVDQGPCAGPRDRRRGLKRLAAALAALGVLAVAALYVSTGARLQRVYAVEPRALNLDRSDEAVERGRHLARIYLCHDCHGEDLGGRVFADIPLTAYLPAGNLTRGRGGAAARYTSGDWVRAVLHGLGRDGRPLVFMPSHQMQHMSDAELAALVAFVEQAPPVDREWPPAVVKLGGRLMMVATSQTVLPAERIDHEAPRGQAPPVEPTAAYGEHLATAIGCRSCHRSDLSGGAGPPPGGSNLTPDGAMKGWTEADFVRAMRAGRRPDGSVLAATMPRDFGSLTDVELRALWLFLGTLPARPSR